MPSEWYWRGSFIGLIALGALYLLVPSFYYFRLPADVRNDPEELAKVLPSWAPKKKLNLGLDLQGGIHLVMDVDLDAAMATKASNRALEMADFLERKGIAGVSGKSVNRTQVQVSVPADKRAQAEKLLAEFEDMTPAGSSAQGLTYAFRPQTVKTLKDGAIEQSITAIRNRIDKFGVNEPVIARRGESHILVQLPGFKDPEQAKELIGKTAQLEFRIVNDQDRSLQRLSEPLPQGVSMDFDSSGAPFLVGPDQRALAAFVEDKAPEGFQYAVGKVEESGKASSFRTFLLEDKAQLTGEYLIDARVQMSQDGIENRPSVSLTFNRRGADLFEKLTGENIQKRMAIVLDGVVDSAPVIQARIAGGNAQITLGGYRPINVVLQEAENLALVLKAGALPAPVTIAEQRSVGASLGPELIRSGALAVAVGTLLVVLFMAIYYALSGFISDVALILNAILIFAALALFGASLSLPGIAGIVLTLGMAVDANVIINERIREELRAGKSPRMAVKLGYEKAFSAIFDSNLTTVLSGIVLLQYGTGPIRGFAVTLIVGITASMFTAIVVTRWIMDLVIAKRPERLSV